MRDLGEELTRERRADLAASFQAASSTSSCQAAPGGARRQSPQAPPRGGWRAIALGGGVAANGHLRERVRELCETEGFELKLVPRELCTDNAAMIASAARFVAPTPYPDYLGWDAGPEVAPARPRIEP